MGDSSKIPPLPPLLQAEQAHNPQPLGSSPSPAGCLYPTRSSMSMPVLYWGAQTGDSVHTWSHQCQVEGRNPFPHLLAAPVLIQPGIWLACFAARSSSSHRFITLSTRTCRNFSAKLYFLTDQSQPVLLPAVIPSWVRDLAFASDELGEALVRPLLHPVELPVRQYLWQVWAISHGFVSSVKNRTAERERWGPNSLSPLLKPPYLTLCSKTKEKTLQSL